MKIISYMKNTQDNVLEMEHDNRKVTATISEILNDSKIIGSYVDDNGYPHLIWRKSLYGELIIKEFNDSRKYNPDEFIIE